MIAVTFLWLSLILGACCVLAAVAAYLDWRDHDRQVRVARLRERRVHNNIERTHVL